MKVYKKLFSYVPKMKYYGWLATFYFLIFLCRINSLWILQYLQISSVSNYCRR